MDSRSSNVHATGLADQDPQASQGKPAPLEEFYRPGLESSVHGDDPDPHTIFESYDFSPIARVADTDAEQSASETSFKALSNNEQ